jgi:hypothetical protein
LRASNTNFDQAAADISKKPVYLAIFDGIAAPNAKYITTEHPTIAAHAIMDLPKTTSQQIRPEDGTSSFGTLGLILQDRDNLITELIRDNPMRGRKLTFKVGYRELAEADFLTLAIGFIQNITVSPDFMKYDFDVRDPQIFGNETIFEPKLTLLNGGVDAVTTAFTVDSTADFPDPAVARFPKLHILVDEEVCVYSAIASPTTFTVVRGQKGTTAAIHSDNAEVNEFIVLKDAGINPITALLQILLSKDGTNHGTYDVLPSHWGLATDPNLIDITTFETKRDSLIPTLQVEYRLAKREKAKEFITQEMFKLLGAYPFVTGSGTMSIRFFERPVPLVTLPRLNETNIRAIQSYDLNLDQMYNRLLWEYDWDPIEEIYRTRQIKSDSSSVTTHGEQPLRPYISKGLRTSLAGQTFIDDRSSTIFYRFADPPPILTLSCHFDQILLESGDHVAITELRLPQNIRTGSRGFGKTTMEIVGQRVDLDRARVDLTLQFISWNREYALWGPDTLLTFKDEALGNQSLYGWWGDADGRLALPAGADATNPATTGGLQSGDLWG